MPKNRPPSRSKQPAADPPETPPGQAEVERAIAAVLDRLKPKPARAPRGAPKSKTGSAKPEPEKPARPVARKHLALVPGSDG